MNKIITVSTPGRICLFGEHQDYLGLPVIAAAISRRVNITGFNRKDGKAIIHLPDIKRENAFDIFPEMPYVHKRDYFRSALNILQRSGGGCMFAYAPQNPEKVAQAIENQGGKAYIISVDEGTICR
jgi:galactokinase